MLKENFRKKKMKKRNWKSFPEALLKTNPNLNPFSMLNFTFSGGMEKELA